MHQVSISLTSVFGIYLLVPSRASEMLWQMSGNCLTGLTRRIQGSADNVSKQFSGYSVFEHYSAAGQDLQAMRRLPERTVQLRHV